MAKNIAVKLAGCRSGDCGSSMAGRDETGEGMADGISQVLEDSGGTGEILKFKLRRYALAQSPI